MQLFATPHIDRLARLGLRRVVNERRSHAATIGITAGAGCGAGLLAVEAWADDAAPPTAR